MNSGQPDYRAQKLLQLMMQSFNQTELNELYFNLSIDSENVPKPANKQAYIEYLLRFMASRNSQRGLIAQLKKARPYLDWPNTYTVPTDIDIQEVPKALHFEQYVKEQHINIYTKPSTRRGHTRKSPTSKNEKLKIIEEGLYKKIFKHTPKMAWFLLILFLLLLGLVPLSFIQKEAIINSGLWYFLILFILGGLALFRKLIFTAVFNRIRSTTNFYDLSVNDRERVKHSLRTERIWGNKVMNFFCRELIRIFLETNIKHADKKKL